MKSAMKSSLRSWLAVFWVGLVVLSAQVKTPVSRRTAIQEKVTVVLKLVQVFVSDKDGRPVAGLKKEDFVLYEDGKEKTITDFEVHDRYREPAVETLGATTAAPARRLNRKFFFLFDLSHSGGSQEELRGLSASKKIALAFLKNQTLPADEIAVLTYSYLQGLKFLEYLTADHEKIVRVIEGLKGILGAGMDGDYSSYPGETVDLGPGYGSLLAGVNPAKDRFMARTADFASALQGFARALGGVAGFKNLVLFSSGVAETILYDLEDSQVRTSFEEMAKELSSSGCPVFAVNTDLAKGKMSSSRGDHFLKQMSGVSGGKYFGSAVEPEAVAESIDEVTGHYYVLGYVIHDTRDGKFHKIRVEVKRPGCSVSGPDGYSNPKPFAELSDFEKRLHLLDLVLADVPHLATPSLFPLSAYFLASREAPAILVMAEIVKEILPEIISSRTEIVSVILDKTGLVIRSSFGEVPFASIANPDIYLYDVVRLPPGNYRFRLVLRNPMTGEGARAETDLVFGAVLAEGLQLSTPFLLTTGPAAAYVKLRKSLPSDEAVAGAGESGIKTFFPFISNKEAPIIDELVGDVSCIYGIVRCAITEKAAPDIELNAALIRKETGQSTELDGFIRKTETLKDTRILLVEFLLPDPAPGSYTFSLKIKDRNSGGEAVASKEFKLIR
jgi:VWFA-related protein